MFQAKEDYTSARRFPSFDTENVSPRYNSRYECELPVDVRRELTRSGPIHRVTVTWRICIGAAGLLAVAILIVISVSMRRKPAAPVAKDAVLEHSKAALQSATPAPEPTPYTSWPSYIAAHQAPRATLIKLPPPRALLVRLPQWSLGEERQLLMPYGLRVLGHYKGQLDAESMLPQSGNVIGDTWIVGDTPWIWIVTPGTGGAQWIDP